MKEFVLDSGNIIDKNKTDLYVYFFDESTQQWMYDEELGDLSEYSSVRNTTDEDVRMIRQITKSEYPDKEDIKIIKD